ncbi:hypothetical protein AD998_17295 [bacterium 336/3]|nr:hypothetical protein AD998_17295 [bacterium 336/3]
MSFRLYIYYFIVVLSIIFSQKSFAQKYTDYKPKYNKWAKNYILDKIEYTDTRTIFYFRYVSEFEYGTVAFFGNGHPERWCIENVDNPEETFYHIDVKNIRKNGKMVLNSLAGSPEVTYETHVGDIFTCEIHFRKLPNRIKKAHLLEGKYQKSSRRHFHALNVKLKTSEDPNLGTFEDMVTRVQEFERINLGTPKTIFKIPPKEQKIPPQNQKIVVNKPIIKLQKPVAPRLNPPTTPEYPPEAKARM